MPTTERAALVVIDLQKGIMQMVPDEVSQPIVDTTNRLAAAVRDAGGPVVWVHATGLPAGRVDNPIPEPEEVPADFTELDERLNVLPADLQIYKQRTRSAFVRTDLEEQLRQQGVETVVLTGIATGAGVESSARTAYDLGFHVTVVRDAVLDGNPERHDATIQHDAPSYGTVADADAIIASLTRE